MPVKVRLARHGRKKRSFYHIVIADSRAPRDGRFIEKIGTYDPNTNPATIDLNFDKALDWIQKGAQPTDTCRAILSYRGVLMKYHLLKGVEKGAFSEEQAEEKYAEWKAQKNAKTLAKRDSLKIKSETEKKKRLDAESKIREAKAQKLAVKNSELAASLGLIDKDAAKAKDEQKPVENENNATADTPVENAEKTEENVIEENDKSNNN